MPLTIINDSTGATLSSGFCSSRRLDNLAAGTYRIIAKPTSSEGTGTYSFKLYTVPDPQVFDLGGLTTTPISISNGAPAAGAGNLETKASQDEYRFTFTAGQSVYFNYIASIGGSGSLPWIMVDDTTGATVSSGNASNKTTTGLPAGTYRLIVASHNTAYMGTYQFKLSVT